MNRNQITTAIPCLALLSCCLLIAGAAAGQSTDGNTVPAVRVVPVADVEWGDLNPDRGAASPRAGDLWGDRTAPGATGFLVKFAKNFASPPHIHNVSYRGLVIQGDVHNDDPEAENMWLAPGSFWSQPAGDIHITSARGAVNMAYIEIDEGPYLVQPEAQAFDNGEASVNVDYRNIVWVAAADLRWAQYSDSGIEVAFLWGDPATHANSGRLIRIPAGHGKVRLIGSTLRTVVIEGRIVFGDDANGGPVELAPGSHVGAENSSELSFACAGDTSCVVYVRAHDEIELRPNQGEAPPDVAALITELGLSEAAAPISANANWNPERVVVMLPRSMGADTAGFEELLTENAGDVQLVFDRSGDLAPSADVLSGADAVLAICTPALLERITRDVLWVHNYRVGMDRCADASDELIQQVTFTNNKRLTGPGIAEHTIAMLLALTRNLPAYVQAQSDARWRKDLAGGPSFGELKGKTMLVVGLGGIGSEIAQRAHGLGMRVIATRNSSRSGPAYVDYVGLADELHTLAGEADVIVNALPLTPDTTGLFDKAFFAAAKHGAIFLSVGRGPSTVTADLLAALQSEKLFGAGLDVTDPEPLPADSPLWQQANVIITPHVAATGGDALHRTQRIAAENLRRYVAGEALLNVVDMRAGY